MIKILRLSTQLVLASLIGIGLGACQPHHPQATSNSPQQSLRTPNTYDHDLANQDLRLWYKRPSVNWNHALPLGNGRLGAMVFGTVEREHLQLNEDTIWAGGPNNNISQTSGAAVPEVRALIDQGKYAEAQQLANRMFISPNNGMPYQTLGSLYIETSHNKVDHYYRDLNIGNALASVRYTLSGVDYQREYFASLTDNAIFVRFTASKPASISLKLGMDSPLDHEVSVDDGVLVIKGQGSAHEGQEGKIRYVGLVAPQVEGGQLISNEDRLIINKANSVTLRITAATNFVRFNDVSADPLARAKDHLASAKKYSYTDAKSRHIAKYQSQFNRVSLELDKSELAHLDTETRIRDFAKQHDPELAALYFQFGRYLLISSSQPGTQPANLQGIWNEHKNPPWDSKYTVNINTEMNYWPAEPTNLSELHEPLFSMLKDLSHTGQESAQKIYGASGWMLHHNTDLWRITGQVDRPFYGQWQTSSAWLTQHLWYRYLHTGDKEFLREYYPVIRGAAEFFKSSLQPHPVSGGLVVSPSNSPENNFLRNSNDTASIAAGNTMDNQLVFDLFDLVINASKILNTDHAFAQEIKQLQAQLPPMQIGRFGQLQEWYEDWDEPTDHHRHISHLYGLYPSNQISPIRTPELAEAAKTSIVHRGDKSTGWSMGWKINWWARLQDGERAYRLLQEQINLTEETSAITEQGGTYANMFDAHPPFQIDGNFGVTAGISEMLVQSHDGAVHLLPALPKAWPNGSVKGLVTRGGFVIDMEWNERKITGLSVHSRLGGVLRLRLDHTIASLALTAASGENPNHFFHLPAIKPIIDKSPKDKARSMIKSFEEYDLITEAGKSYRIL